MTMVVVGGEKFPCSDAAGAGLREFLAGERQAYFDLHAEAEKRMAEAMLRHQADMDAAEDLLAEAQERLERSDRSRVRMDREYERRIDRLKNEETRLERMFHYEQDVCWMRTKMLGFALFVAVVAVLAHIVR